MLTFFYDYQKAGGIHMMDAIKIMTLDNDNWSFEKSAKIFGICVYCGFLGGSNSHQRAECCRWARNRITKLQKLH